jgi:energy-coupling factor transport system permease protein
MFQNISLGIYYPGQSFLHKLQARTKLLALFWLIIAMMVANQRRWHFAPYIFLVALVSLAVVISGVGLRVMWRQIRLLLLFAVLGAIPTVLFLETEGTPLYSVGPLTITDRGVWLLMSIFTLFLALYALALLLTMTTTPVALIEGLTLLLAPLRRARLPVDGFALMTLLALRFIPTLFDEVEQLIKAQTARGADFAHGPLSGRLRGLASLVVPLTQGALRRAADLAEALEARGDAPEDRSTPLHETTLGRADYLALGVLVMTMLGALIV